jgi:hypothetical protein
VHPVVLEVIDISTQVLLKSLVLALSLSVGLRMVCGSEPSVNTQMVTECYPEL